MSKLLNDLLKKKLSIAGSTTSELVQV